MKMNIIVQTKINNMSRLDEIIDDNSMDKTGLVVNEQMKKDLLTAAKWGKFLSIMGFISTGFMVLAALGMTAMTSNPAFRQVGMSPMVIVLMYLFIAGIYFTMSYLLFQFSNKTKMAVIETNTMSLQEGFKALANLYKFAGILTIITIALYFLFIIFLVGAAASNGF
jgi:hypothetical protein